MASQEPITEVSPALEVIQLLKDIEQRSGQSRKSLPQQEEAHSLWDGIVFSVSGIPVVTLLSEVKEILNLPSSLTLIPGSKRWMLGIANIRGNLLPIIDLQLFLGGKPISIAKRSRVLVIDHSGVRVGLLVGGVQGIRHFQQHQQMPVPELTEGLSEFCNQAFGDDDETWPVFDMSALSENQEFQVAAI